MLKDEVQAFLTAFKAKMGYFDIVFLSRDKNLKTLIDLEITGLIRKEILKDLCFEDYFKGPSKDVDKGPDLWKFGKLIKRQEVYIKITMGSVRSFAFRFILQKDQLNIP